MIFLKSRKVNVGCFEEVAIFRLFPNEIKEAKKIVQKAQTTDFMKKYENLSHFYRCAIINLIREEKNKLR